MTDKLRPYLFYDVAISICSTCYRRVDAKIVFEDDKVWMLKRCPQHGHSARAGSRRRRLLSSLARGLHQDAGAADGLQHAGQIRLPLRLRTLSRPRAAQLPGAGGDLRRLQPDLPDLLRGLGPHRTEYRSLEQIDAMLDCVVRNERQPDVVQISGGEPTLHPEFFRVLDMCKERPIRHLMVNTNGVRIAKDDDFAKRLADFMPQFEVYLQFDSLRARAADAVARRRSALHPREGARAPQQARHLDHARRHG